MYFARPWQPAFRPSHVPSLLYCPTDPKGGKSWEEAQRGQPHTSSHFLPQSHASFLSHSCLFFPIPRGRLQEKDLRTRKSSLTPL